MVIHYNVVGASFPISDTGQGTSAGPWALGCLAEQGISQVLQKQAIVQELEQVTILSSFPQS